MATQPSTQSKKKTTKKKTAAKRPTKRASAPAAKKVRKKPAAPTVAKVSAKAAATNPPAVTWQRRREMIAEAAYYKAERRGFAGGDSSTDWNEAEAEIDAMLATREP